MDKDPQIFLGHIFECIEYIEKYTANKTKADFIKSQETQDAVFRRMEIIGEAVKNLPEKFKENYPRIPWRKMSSMRDRLIHEYFGVNRDLVWETLQDDLPKLKEQIKEIL